MNPETGVIAMCGYFNQVVFSVQLAYAKTSHNALIPSI